VIAVTLGWESARGNEIAEIQLVRKDTGLGRANARQAVEAMDG
jgi:hypothetical protein